ncbi:hypothetical protein KP509_07G016600 [Ceratopteris richardii]|nr:hypothetical protein KP509_07G016600 [Ceratopteris richardii]
MLLHNWIVKSFLSSDTLIGSSLVDMYAKCGSLQEAQRVFDYLPKRTVISWSAIIAGYADHGYGDLAHQLFEDMKAANFIPDKITFTCALKACISLESLEKGQEIHEDVKKLGLQKDIVVGTALVDMYSKCGRVEEAQIVFDEMDNRNELTWGALMSGYARQGYGFPVLELLEAMQEEDIKPNKVMFLSLLRACGNIGAVLHGRWIHAKIIIHSLDIDTAIRNSIVDMYARCGSLDEAQRVFSLIQDPDVVSWSSLFAGYAQNGTYDVAAQQIEAMDRGGIKPNTAIFASLLSACSRAGVMAEGCEFFNDLIEDFGLLPSLEHYSCVIDLLGRGGCFNEAKDLLKTMPSSPNFIARMSLLTHTRTFNNPRYEAGSRYPANSYILTKVN